jgi:hypothetical protein
MTVTGMTTKLEAVNVMLSSIGEEPIEALGDNNPDDAISAQEILDESTREILSRGWHFNSDFNVQLVPDANGQITVPDDVSRIDVTGANSGGRDIVYRKGVLFDKEANSDEFTAPVLANVVRLFEFEEIPQSLRRWITIKASRLFVDRILGEDAVGRYTRQEEISAEQQARREEIVTGNFSILTNNQALQRRSPLDYYGFN